MSLGHNESVKQRFGFSILEMMIGIAILATVMVGFSQFLNGAMKGQKSVQNAVDFDILKTSINAVLNTQACDGAFQGSSGLVQLFAVAPPSGPGELLSAPVAIQQIKQGSAVIVDRAQPALGGGLTLSNLEFTSALADGGESVTESGVTTLYSRYVVTLHVAVAKSAGSMGGTGFSKIFSARVLVDPANGFRIEKCSKSEGVPKSFFHADLNPTDQALTSSMSNTKVIYTREFSDTLDEFDLTTSRFTPKNPGTYLLNATVTIDTHPAPVGNCGPSAWIYKNGVRYQWIGSQVAAPSWNMHVLRGSALAEADGTTDYFEVFAQSNCASSPIKAGWAYTTFSGAAL